MPYPTNLKVAQEVESIIRSNGSIPATIAIMDGKAHIGLTDTHLTRLAESSLSLPPNPSRPKAIKASRRDLAHLLATKSIGSTTVAGTMCLAHAAGIKVFVTGGIGGVHRGGEITWDVSADLMELGRTPVAVVCAGVKSILDVERTLEVLETQGVPVVTYGTDEVPAFYTRSSGFKGIARVDSPLDAAKLIKSNNDLKLRNGVLITVPIPESEVAIDSNKLNLVISQAVQEAESRSIKGKDVTPFLLDRIKNVTAGKSLQSNVALIRNNAMVGSQIAKSLSSLSRPSSQAFTSYPSSSRRSIIPTHLRPLIIGGTVLDITSRPSNPKAMTGGGPSTSHPGKVMMGSGGVGRNVAEACFRTGGEPRFWSCIGGDEGARAILGEGVEDMYADYVKTVPGARTATYSAFLDGTGNLVGAVADMDINAEIECPDFDVIDAKGIVCVDGNVRLDVIAKLSNHVSQPGSPIGVFEPTSIPKALPVMEMLLRKKTGFQIATPDLGEALVMARAIELHFKEEGRNAPRLLMDQKPSILDGNSPHCHITKQANAYNSEHPGLEPAIPLLSTYFTHNVIKLGKDGVIISSVSSQGSLLVHHIPATKSFSEVVSVTGAGDTLVGTMITSISRDMAKHDEENPGVPFKLTASDVVKGVTAGVKAAELTLMSVKAVSDQLDASVLE
ncbi:hypothetical protein HDU97_007040 [Phlyctochytrium planicorne]|nr:hypothetical protein HDU97_007040 [Phlyctochytrium planicorne]